MAIELPSDLVEEIISWVPAISLVRLRYTCKEWKTLIADPRFVKKHLSHMRCREQQFTLFNNFKKPCPSSGSTFSFVGIDLNELEKQKPCLNLQVFEQPNLLRTVMRMSHCDGLLLYVMMINRLLVLNPLLKQGRWIECGYGLKNYVDTYGLGYVCNQSSLSSCNDYKIVKSHCDNINGDSRVEVYSFKSHSWKTSVDKTSNGLYRLPESSVCLQGTPYWIAYDKSDKKPVSIQSFDFSKERFETLVLPPSHLSSNALSYLMNNLSLGIFRRDQLSLLLECGLTSKIHLWVKKKKKQHWSWLVAVAIPITDRLPIYGSRYLSFFNEKNGKLEIFIESGYISIYIEGYKQECQKVEYNTDMGRTFSGCYYVPSLLWLPGFSEVEISRRRSWLHCLEISWSDMIVLFLIGLSAFLLWRRM